MDGIHDFGGMHGFGKVQHTNNSLTYKPVFHEDWEYLGYGLLFLAADALKAFSVDELRHAVERMRPHDYVTAPYFDRIIIGTATLLVEQGVITKEELDECLGGDFKLAGPATGEGRLAKTGRTPFEVGDLVEVRDEFVSGHIRMPSYVRGKQGTVLHRTTHKWPFPDAIGHRKDAALEPTYHVRFKVSDLWGTAADDGFVVVDLFESYLDKVSVAFKAAAPAPGKVAELV